LYRRAVPGLRLLLRLAPLLIGALAAAVWLERRRRAQGQLVASEPAPELEPVAAPRSPRFEREPAPEPIDIVTIVDDLLTVGR
jgi:hypothetical protein